MALDTATKRRSMLAMGVLALIVHPVPDGTVAAIDQKHFLGLMAAVATRTGVATDNIHIYSTSLIEPNHAADTGGDVLVENVIEAQGGGYFGGPDNYVKLTADGNALIPTGKVFIGPTASMLAPLNITGDTADIGDRHEGLWLRSKVAAWILQLNVRGPRLEIGGGATLDATPAMSVNYDTGKVGIGTTTPGYILDIDAGEIGDNTYDGLRIIDTGWKAVSHPMLEFYNSHASFNASLARIYGEIGNVGTNSKLYFAVADSSKNLQNRMVIDKSGKVGIGTTSPDETLQVVGSAKFGDDDTNFLKIATDGEVSLAGTARVRKEIIIGAGSFHKGVSAPDTGYINSVIETLDFDKTSTQHGHYNTIVPHDMAAGTDITVQVDWFFDDVEADHYMTWELEYLLLADGEDPTTAPTAIWQKSVISTGNNDKQIHTTFATAITGGVADDALAIRFSRDADATNDTDDLNQDARMLVVHLHYISDKLGAN